MHNRALHDTLATFVEEAAAQLTAELAGGSQVPYDLDVARGRRGGSPLYCYKPLTGAFIAGQGGALTQLETYRPAVQQLSLLPSLDAFFELRGEHPPRGERREVAEVALISFLAEVWAEAAEFAWDPTRFEAAYTRLEGAAYEGCALTVVLAPVEGLVIESDRVGLGEGMTLARTTALDDAPHDLRSDAFGTVAVLVLESAPEEPAGLEAAGRKLRRLQTALRLWDDAEPAIGPTAWARTDHGPWLQIPLSGGLRRMGADCLLAAEEEDPLRAFCTIVARRTPRAGELAWALRRFELGCERPGALESLTDWLLAAHALLGGPDAPGAERGLVRLAAICAPPEERDALTARLGRTAALERAAIAGLVRPEPAVDADVAALGAMVRAVLRDVLCGHLETDLRAVADGLLAVGEPEPAGQSTPEFPALS